MECMYSYSACHHKKVLALTQCILKSDISDRANKRSVLVLFAWILFESPRFRWFTSPFHASPALNETFSQRPLCLNLTVSLLNEPCSENVCSYPPLYSEFFERGAIPIHDTRPCLSGSAQPFDGDAGRGNLAWHAVVSYRHSTLADVLKVTWYYTYHVILYVPITWCLKGHMILYVSCDICTYHSILYVMLYISWYSGVGLSPY